MRVGADTRPALPAPGRQLRPYPPRPRARAAPALVSSGGSGGGRTRGPLHVDERALSRTAIAPSGEPAFGERALRGWGRAPGDRPSFRSPVDDPRALPGP